MRRIQSHTPDFDPETDRGDIDNIVQSCRIAGCDFANDTSVLVQNGEIAGFHVNLMSGQCTQEVV